MPIGHGFGNLHRGRRLYTLCARKLSRHCSSTCCELIAAPLPASVLVTSQQEGHGPASNMHF